MKEIQVAEVVSPFYFSFEPRMVFQVLSGRWPALTSLRTFLFFSWPVGETESPVGSHHQALAPVGRARAVADSVTRSTTQLPFLQQQQRGE